MIETPHTAMPDLLGKDVMAADLPAVISVPVASIVRGKKAGPDLIAAIRAAGLYHPVTLQALPALTADGAVQPPLYKVLAGERRVDAVFQIDSMGFIDARVYPVGAKISPEVVKLIENWTRKPNVGAELEAITTLVKQGYKAKEIANGLRRPIGSVKRYVRLVNLPPVLHQAVIKGKIGQTLATEIIKLPAQRQKELSDLYVRNGKLTPGDIREQRMVASAAFMSSLPSSMFGDDEYTQPAVGDAVTPTDGPTANTTSEKVVALGLPAHDVQELISVATAANRTDLAKALRRALFAQT